MSRCSLFGQKCENNAASVDRTQDLQKSHGMRDSSELQSGALPGELKRLDGCVSVQNLIYRLQLSHPIRRALVNRWNRVAQMGLSVNPSKWKDFLRNVKKLNWDLRQISLTFCRTLAWSSSKTQCCSAARLERQNRAQIPSLFSTPCLRPISSRVVASLRIVGRGNFSSTTR